MTDFKNITKKTCYVIAEIGLNHNGSIELAKELILIAKEAGCDAVKFQKRDVDNLATKETLDSKDDRFPSFGDTYRKIREFLEFDKEEYLTLKLFAEKQDIDFIVTAFDINSFNFLKDIGVKTIKIASHSLTNLDLLEYISKNNFTSILSTGMAEVAEIDAAVEIFKKNNCFLCLLHCVSSYPTPPEECNLELINYLKKRYNLITGYSGHELGFFPTLIAVSMGASIVERHITTNNKLEGFDHKLSLEPGQLSEMVKKIREIEIIRGGDSKQVSEAEKITRCKYHVSMTSNQKLYKGQILDKSMISFKNPGTGIPPKKANNFYGKKINQDIENSKLILPDMFD